jgi:hypothetical protein
MSLLIDLLKRLLNQHIQLRFNQMPLQLPLLLWKRPNQPLKFKSQLPPSLNQSLLKRRKRRKHQRKKLPNQRQPPPESQELKDLTRLQRSLLEQPPKLELSTEEEKLELRLPKREPP